MQSKTQLEVIRCREAADRADAAHSEAFTASSAEQRLLRGGGRTGILYARGPFDDPHVQRLLQERELAASNLINAILADNAASGE